MPKSAQEKPVEKKFTKEDMLEQMEKSTDSDVQHEADRQKGEVKSPRSNPDRPKRTSR